MTNINKEMTQNLEVSISENDNNFYINIKRLIDIIFASIGILLLLPVFIIVALIIKFEDPQGPVFFKQERVGKNGKTFVMYKFRSMVSDAEKKLENLLLLNETSGAMFKLKDDPRVTKVGKFIRKTSIDELPQLYNVILGNMSLVGPRPPLKREVDTYNNFHLQRLLVTPGCTGLWQVSGRSDIGFEDMVKLDIEYIKRKSIIFDVKIIFQTVIILFNGKGAY